MSMNKLHLIGYASGIGGVDVRCGEGPLVLRESKYVKALAEEGLLLEWAAMLHPPQGDFSSADAIRDICSALAQRVAKLVRARKFFTVIGGDHTCAIGTWSGAYDAVHEKGDIGLVWIDAHMDSNTPETSETGRIHGMPVASLLGYGYRSMTTILQMAPKLKPQYVCLIGVRSFESGEEEFLNKQKVRVFTMAEVENRGFATVLKEAIAIASKGTVGYGLSIDLDSIDPKEAPGVDVPEPGGIAVADLTQGLQQVVGDPKMLGVELVEFDPSRDLEQKTEKLLAHLLKIFATR